MIVRSMNARRNNVFTGVHQWNEGRLINGYRSARAIKTTAH